LQAHFFGSPYGINLFEFIIEEQFNSH